MHWWEMLIIFPYFRRGWDQAAAPLLPAQSSGTLLQGLKEQLKERAQCLHNVCFLTSHLNSRTSISVITDTSYKSTNQKDKMCMIRQCYNFFFCSKGFFCCSLVFWVFLQVHKLGWSQLNTICANKEKNTVKWIHRHTPFQAQMKIQA